MATPSLESIFEAITPDNIKNIPVIKHTMQDFIDNLEANSKIARQIISLYDTEKYSDDSKIIQNAKQRVRNGLYLLYVNTLYKCLQNISTSKEVNKILNTFNYINSPLKKFQDANNITSSITPITTNPSIADLTPPEQASYFATSGASRNINSDESSTETEISSRKYIQKSDATIGKAECDVNTTFATTVINNEYISSNREFSQKVGTQDGLKYIYAFAKYIETGSVENDFTVDEVNPFIVHYEGSLNSTIFNSIVKAMAHPVGWTYDYTTVFTIALRDYFGIEFIYKFTKLEVQDQSGNFCVFTDKTKEEIFDQFRTEINPKTQLPFTDDEISRQVSVVENRHVYDYQYWEDQNGYSHQLISFDDKDEHILYRDGAKQLIYYTIYEDYVNGLKLPERVFDEKWSLNMEMTADVRFLYSDEIEQEEEFQIGWIRDSDHEIQPTEASFNEDKNMFKVVGEPYVYVQGVDESRNRCLNHNSVNKAAEKHVATLELNQDYDGTITVYDDDGNSETVNCIKNRNIIANGEIDYWNSKVNYSRNDYVVHNGLIFKSLMNNNTNEPKMANMFEINTTSDLNEYILYNGYYYKSLSENNDSVPTDQTKWIFSNLTQKTSETRYDYYDENVNYELNSAFFYDGKIYLVTFRDATNSVKFESVIPDCNLENRLHSLEIIYDEPLRNVYPIYSSENIYTLNNKVIHDGKVYRCKVNSYDIQNGEQIESHSVYGISVDNEDVWERSFENPYYFKITSKVWKDSTTYKLNDIVSYNETNYISLKDLNFGVLPGTDDEYWTEYDWQHVNYNIIQNSKVEIDTHKLKGEYYTVEYNGGGEKSESFWFRTSGLNSNSEQYYINVPIVYTDESEKVPGYGVLITGHNEAKSTVYVEVSDRYNNVLKTTANCDNSGNFRVRVNTTHLEKGKAKVYCYARKLNGTYEFKRFIEFNYLNNFDKSPNFCGLLKYKENIKDNTVLPEIEPIFQIQNMINFNSNSEIEHVRIGEQRDGSFAPGQTWVPDYFSKLDHETKDAYLEDYTDNLIIDNKNNILKDKIIHGNIIDGIDYWKSNYNFLDEDVFVNYGRNHEYIYSYGIDSLTDDYVPLRSEQLKYIQSCVGYIEYHDKDGNVVEFDDEKLKNNEITFVRYYISERDNIRYEEDEFEELKNRYNRTHDAYTSDFIIMTSDKCVQESFDISFVGRDYYLYTTQEGQHEVKDEECYLYSTDGFYFNTNEYSARGTAEVKTKEDDYKYYNDVIMYKYDNENTIYDRDYSADINQVDDSEVHAQLDDGHFLHVEGFKFSHGSEGEKTAVNVYPDSNVDIKEVKPEVTATFDRTKNYYVNDTIDLYVYTNTDDLEFILSDGIKINGNSENSLVKINCLESGPASITINAYNQDVLVKTITLDLIVLKRYITPILSEFDVLRKNSEFEIHLEHNVDDYRVYFNEEKLQLLFRRNDLLRFKCLRPADSTAITFIGSLHNIDVCESQIDISIADIYLNVDLTPREAYESDVFEIGYSTDADDIDVRITEFELGFKPDVEYVEMYEGDDLALEYNCNSDENINISIDEQKN
jgi:hypothetical protein